MSLELSIVQIWQVDVIFRYSEKCFKEVPNSCRTPTLRFNKPSLLNPMKGSLKLFEGKLGFCHTFILRFLVAHQLDILVQAHRERR